MLQGKLQIWYYLKIILEIIYKEKSIPFYI